MISGHSTGCCFPLHLVTDHSLLRLAASFLLSPSSMDNPSLSQPQESVIAFPSSWNTLPHVFQGMLSLIRELAAATSSEDVVSPFLPSQSACFLCSTDHSVNTSELFICLLSPSAFLHKNRRCVRLGTFYVLFTAVFPVSVPGTLTKGMTLYLWNPSRVL